MKEKGTATAVVAAVIVVILVVAGVGAYFMLKGPEGGAPPGGEGGETPPNKVTGLLVTDLHDGKLNLTWNSATDSVAIDHYNIYRDGTLLTTVTSTSYIDNGLTDNQQYSYQVSATDTSNNEGEKSASVSGTPTPTPAPGDILLSERPDLEHYPRLLSVLSETTEFKTELSDNEKQILDRIVDAYEKLTPLEQASLMFSPSQRYPITDTPFMSKGDVLYWVATEFLDRTDLGEDDEAIWLVYAAVFDDFFEIKTNSQEEVNWAKEYMIRQYEFFGREKLIAIGERYDGTIGIMHVINPLLYNVEGFVEVENHIYEMRGLSEIFITIEAYENLKGYMQTNYCDDGKNLEQLLQENPSSEGLQTMRSYIFTHHISEYGTLEFSPTFPDYYSTVVTKVLIGEKQPGTCVTISQLVVLGSRAVGIPVGFCSPGTSPHVGTYIIYNSSIIPDVQSGNPIEYSIQGWPTATYSRGYDGISRNYTLKDCVNPPDIKSYIMPIEDIVPVIEEIYNRPYPYP